MFFEKLQAHLKGYLEGKKYYYALKALSMARTYHTGKRKDEITKEIQHQYEIVLYLMSLKLEKDEELILTAGLLHDILEDYSVDKDSLINLFGQNQNDILFGKKVYELVWRLTKKHNQIKKTNEEYFNEISRYPYAAIIKGADRINNIQTMIGVFSVEKTEEYLKESEEWILPAVKNSKRNFPEHSMELLNIQQMLKNQISLIKHYLSLAKKESK